MPDAPKRPVPRPRPPPPRCPTQTHKKPGPPPLPPHLPPKPSHPVTIHYEPNREADPGVPQHLARSRPTYDPIEPEYFGQEDDHGALKEDLCPEEWVGPEAPSTANRPPPTVSALPIVVSRPEETHTTTVAVTESETGPYTGPYVLNLSRPVRSAPEGECRS